MPIYEYACEKCGKVTEKLESFSSKKDVIVCPECGGEAKSIMSSSAFHLKGGGWYAQGYGKESKAPSCPASGPKCQGCPASKG